MTASLRVTVLVDNTTITDRYFCGEPGLSLFIETGGKKILFDTGYSGLFLENCKKDGDRVSRSGLLWSSRMGHLDHTGGLVSLARYLMEAAIEKTPCHKPGLIAHPRCFRPKEHAPLENNGSILDEAEVRRHFDVTLSDRPVQIMDDLVFLGRNPAEVSRSSGGITKTGGSCFPTGAPSPISFWTIRPLPAGRKKDW